MHFAIYMNNVTMTVYSEVNVYTVYNISGLNKCLHFEAKLKLY